MSELFFDRLNKIDEVIARGSETCDLSRDVEPYLLEDASIHYFFNNLQDPAWLELLIRAGKFRKVPEPKKDIKKGTAAPPPWPESRYLARMAAISPNKVLEVALQISDTENVWVHEDLADAALAMPADLAAKLVVKAKHWLEFPSLILLPEKLGKLVSHLALNGQIEEAIDLCEALLTVLPDQNPSTEPQARFDDWYYEQILVNHIPDLVEAAGERALILLCDLLNNAISFSLNLKEEKGSDYSYIWRPAIEDHNQNHPYGIKCMLVTAVRDAAESLIETSGKDILEIVEKRTFKVFLRISLHLRRKWPEVDSEGTANWVTNPNAFDDVDLNYEFFHLLHEQFNIFPQKTQQKYLDLIAKGPYQEDDEYNIHHWRYVKLWPIQEFLNKKWKEQFDELKNEFGELKHPDFHSYSSITMGPVSPKTGEDLKSMSFDELMEFLKRWDPIESTILSPSLEGLGRELSVLVASEPESFAIKAQRFQEVDPTYVYKLLLGFNEALKNNKEFQWPQIIDLCRWVMNQSTDKSEQTTPHKDYNTGWPLVRGVIPILFSTGFKSNTSEIPFDLRTNVWEVLQLLTNDSDPTPEDESLFGRSNPLTFSINTTRGEAMHAVIYYALWVKRHIGLGHDKMMDIEQGFEGMPEVEEVLNYHLEPTNDPVLAIRAIYGEWLPWLHKLDPQWVVQSKSKIFPMDTSYQELHDVAWESYIIHCAPYINVFEILREEYNYAIDRIGTLSSERQYLANPDERLVEHIMTYYWRGKLNLDETGGLLTRLYIKAPDSLREYALDFIGRNLYNTEEVIKPNILKRLKALWEQRFEAVHVTNPSELVTFGWWFVSAKFDDEWAIEQLKNVLKINGTIKPDHLVIEHLATLTEKIPLFVVECLALLVESDKEGWRIHRSKKQAHTILKFAIQSTDKTIQQIAQNIIHSLGSRGYLEFRDLLS